MKNTYIHTCIKFEMRSYRSMATASGRERHTNAYWKFYELYLAFSQITQERVMLYENEMK